MELFFFCYSASLVTAQFAPTQTDSSYILLSAHVINHLFSRSAQRPHLRIYPCRRDGKKKGSDQFGLLLFLPLSFIFAGFCYFL